MCFCLSREILINWLDLKIYIDQVGLLHRVEIHIFCLDIKFSGCEAKSDLSCCQVLLKDPKLMLQDRQHSA